jgi:hypothetical protein
VTGVKVLHKNTRREKMVYGIGYVKDIKITKEIRPYYNRWKSMIGRCYYPKHGNYSKYGAKGVVVDERWHCFDNFYEDIKKLDGWDEEKFLNGEIHLDKDSILKENKVYCKEYCCWLPKKKNSEMGYKKQQKLIIATNEELGIEIITTQRNIAKKYGLTLTNINRCLKGKQKQHKGWTFKYV